MTNRTGKENNKSGASGIENSFVLRVYCRDPDKVKSSRRQTDQANIVGTAEQAGTGAVHRFKSVEELWQILAGD